MAWYGTFTFHSPAVSINGIQPRTGTYLYATFIDCARLSSQNILPSTAKPVAFTYLPKFTFEQQFKTSNYISQGKLRYPVCNRYNVKLQRFTRFNIFNVY